SDLDRFGQIRAREWRGLLEVVTPRVVVPGRARGDVRHQTLSAGREVQELHALRVQLDRGQRLREWPEDAARAPQREPAVVDGDVDEVGIRLQLHLDLSQVVVQIGVLEREADEAV